MGRNGRDDRRAGGCTGVSAVAHFAWLGWPETATIITCLGDENIRFVGGAVRDALLGLPVADIDIATPMLPEEVIRRARAQAITAVPTGIDHGTVTLVAGGRSFEVTTLRRDVSTDGRRATVAFTDDWREDAARRDFTINALYADCAGTVYDWFGGRDDLAAGRVRFIGDPQQRIHEDALRILRFFRFSARFVRGALDDAGLVACIAHGKAMMALSRERIRSELLKLLGADDPLMCVEAMHKGRLFDSFLPEVISTQRLAKLMPLEKSRGLGDGLRRLAALLPAEAQLFDAVAMRLKCSTQERKRLVAMAGDAPVDIASMKQALYELGAVSAVDRLLLSSPAVPLLDACLALVGDWPIPASPFSGRHVVARGVASGPAVSAVLQRFERLWIDAGFVADDAAQVQLLQQALAETKDT
jgi:poly(A) polymerase